MVTSKIGWCDTTWNPTKGCSRVSSGCDHCWAERMANRMRDSYYKGLVADGRWTGETNLDAAALEKPLHWRKPRRIAVGLMGDLFHESRTFQDIAAVYGVMSSCPQHTFLAVTKRPARRLEWFAWMDRVRAWRMDRAARHARWPCPNVWEGVSVEDQATAEERIPELMRTPAAHRWVSVEPILGPVDIAPWLSVGVALDWVVVGGESGPSARSCDVAWIRSVVNQCREAKVPCWTKQLGPKPYEMTGPSELRFWRQRDGKGADPAEWPTDLRVRDLP